MQAADPNCQPKAEAGEEKALQAELRTGCGGMATYRREPMHRATFAPLAILVSR